MTATGAPAAEPARGEPARTRTGRPWQLWLPSVVVTGEAAALLGFGGWLLYETEVARASNDAVARGSTAYFAALGTLVAVVAVFLWRRLPWTHGAAVFLQVLALPIAWTMVSGGFWAGGAVLAALAVGALAGLLSPPGRAALGR